MTQLKENNSCVKVPAQSESSIVDVSMKHLLLGFGIIIMGVFVTSTGIILIREQARYKRQQAMLDSALMLVKTIKRKENHASQ
ncbi:MAG: hypothetical protein HOF29_13215 [Candidatus Marinimicrobia bacterium]|jgi:hypothetical protein|nr:hypothetical protein [Candidatus Neomarinimicrobiota bacterium]